MSIKPGRYIHFKGNEYEVTGMATHSETMEELVIYRARHGDGSTWARPAAMWEDALEHKGRRVKRFTHEDEIAAGPPAGIHKRSPPSEKIGLFLSLFSGREDVFAKRWERNGRNGYSPVCRNEWSPPCSKKKKKDDPDKVKCGDCPNHDFVQFDAVAVEQHLNGEETYGLYPMYPDETCRFIVFDFDGKKDYDADVLRDDVAAIREACDEKGISMAVERSRSGKGIHFWIFFTENMPASAARKFGSSIITYSTGKRHKLSFKTYDRIIPMQDTFHKGLGGFGNLIALPLQKKPREEGNSVFVDEGFNAYPDQWGYLYGIRKYTPAEIEAFTRQLSPSGDLGELHRDVEDEKPWEQSPTRRKKKQALTRLDFPDTVEVVRSNMLYIEKSGISSPALNALKRLAAFRNPEFYKKQAMRKSTHDTPRIISCADETEQYLCLPRGLEDEVSGLLEDAGVDAAHTAI